MRKLMEIYEAENGLIIKKEKKTYHLFYSSTEEKTESIKITNTKEAFVFLTDFFADKLKIDKKEWITEDSFGHHIQYRLMLEDMPS